MIVSDKNIIANKHALAQAEEMGINLRQAAKYLDKINDEEMCKRLMNLNPNSFRRMVSSLLEVNGRGYWQTYEENIEKLQELYQEVEDRIEGIE